MVFLCFGVSGALASRAFVPMGDRVRQSEVVALADTRPADTTGQGTLLILREIIKGEPALKGQEISLPIRESSADVSLPQEAKGIAVLLPEDWRTEERPLLEVYQQVNEIEALRVFAMIYELPSERARLLALQARISDANALFRRQLFYDLAGMRDAANFEILTGLFPKGDEGTQREVIDLIGKTGDLRGVPTLMAALDSPHPWVALEAARELAFTFRGAPGVTEVFRRVMEAPGTPQHKLLKDSAAAYLIPYDAALAAQYEAGRNAYQRASERLQRGDEAGARPFFDLILSDPAQTDSIIRFNADWVAHLIREEPDKEEDILRSVMPVLTRYSREGDYLQAVSAAKLLSALQHPDSAVLLLELLNKAGNSLFDGSTRIAAFALADRGAELKQQAMMRLNVREDWPAVQPVFAEFDDEGLSLIAMLSAEKAVGAEEWILYRLGALREKRAAEPLVHYLTENPWGHPQATAETLIQIGGVEVEAAALRLLSYPDENGVRGQAAEIIFRLQGDRALPFARRMITEANFGVKSSAALFLSRHGFPEDLRMLIPLSDFWTGDRANHYWLMGAISEIRSRHSYDLNGPIEKQ